MELFSLNFLTI